MAKEHLQQAHWVDQVVDQILEWQEKNGITKLHVDDMKTPSGRVHVGALRGVVLHDIVAKALAKKTSGPVTSTYVFNDLDNMDGLPHYMNQEIYSAQMGKSLYRIPRPELHESGIRFTDVSQEEIQRYENTTSMAEFYAIDFIDAFRYVGCEQEIVWSHKLYQQGKFDQVIREVLDKVEAIKKIYIEVADYKLPDDWYPYQVRCQNCQIVGSTLATAWDGEYVSYECQPNKVEWAKGCGHTGKVKPIGDNGKLLWKMDWPAHWKVMGITIEGAGKDHSTEGGSRDMASKVCEQVLDIPEPFNIPYEWILLRGAKMSSSKGVGTSAREFVKLFPPEIARFLFVNKNYNQVIDFDPQQTMAIPDLYDEYDQSARIYWGVEAGDERLGRSFVLSQISENISTVHFLPRFRDVATWMQYPDVNLIDKCAEVKGSPLNEVELQLLEERKQFAEIWIATYAPREYAFTPQPTFPIEAEKLTAEQITFVLEAIALSESQQWSNPQDLQQAIFDKAKPTLGAKTGFQAIYLALIGKTHGPRAAWLLLSLSQNIASSRKNQLEIELENKEIKQITYQLPEIIKPEIITIDQKVGKAHPSISLGVAIIRGVKIQKSLPELNQAKQEILNSITGLTRDSINEIPEVQAYRELYKSMKVKYQSRRPSPEALLRRIADGKELYTVNTCVDAYNLAVLKNKVSVGAFDLNNVQLPTVLKFAEGGEQILLLGDQEPTIINSEEICYFDQQGAYNLDFNYRDAQRTSVTEQTTDILLNVDGIGSISRAQVEQTLQDSIDLIVSYCGGTVELAGIVIAK